MDIDELLEKGFQFLNEGDTVAAKGCFNKVLLIDTHNAKAYLGLGVCFHIENIIEEAEKCYLRAIEINPEFDDAYFNLGLLYDDKGEIEEAEKCYRKAIQINPENDDAYVNLGNLLKVKGEIEEAEKCYRKAIQINPENDDAYVNLGNLLKVKGEIEEAEKCYLRAIEINPENDDAYVNLGNLLKVKGEIEEAEKCYLRAIEINPENDAAYFNLGNLLKVKGEIEEAEKCYLRAIEINPEFDDAYFNLGLLYDDKGEIEEAEKCYLRAIEINPENDAAYFNLGNLLNDKGEIEEAEKCYLRAIEINPENDAAYVNLGVLLNDKGEIEEAEKCYLRAIEINPEFDAAYVNLGVLLNDKGEIEEAEKCYLRAIEINPENDAAYFNLGNLLNDKGEIEEAEKCYLRAIEINPENDAAYVNLGVLLNDKGEIEEAEKCYLRAIEINPEFDAAYVNLGVLLNDKGEIEEAEKCYLRAIEINPENDAAYFNLGLLFNDKGDNKTCFFYFKIAFSLNPFIPEFCFGLFKIPVELNIDRTRHFYRGMFLSIIQNNYKVLGKNLSNIMELDAPMLIQQITAGIPLNNMLDYSSYNLIIQESIDQTKYFNNTIQIWRSEKKCPGQSLLSEAIINYYLGNPIKAFQIFDKEMDNENVGLNLMGQYYYSIVAYEIMEEEEAILEDAYLQAEAELKKDNLPFIDKYYAALIFYLHGNYEKAIDVLENLFPDHLVAGYKLAEIFEALHRKTEVAENHIPLAKEGIHSPKAISLLDKINILENERRLYKFGHEVIRPSCEEENFLNDIMPIVHFMEVEQMVGHIFVKPFDIRKPFYNLIQLADEDEKQESLSLKHLAFKAWQQSMEADLEIDELEDLYNGFSNYKNPAIRLGEAIQNGAKAEFFDAKENHKNPVQFNFKLYLLLNTKLYSQQRITQQKAIVISDYIYTCIDALPKTKNFHSLALVITSVRDFILSANIPYISYLQRLVLVAKLLKTENKGKESPILNYNDFCALYNELDDLHNF